MTSRQPPVPPTSPRTALVIRPRFIGDICLTLPVLDNLRRLAPQAALHYLVEDEAAPLLEGDPRLAKLWVTHRRASGWAQARLLAALRGARFDLVLDLFCNPRTALWTAVTGAPLRVGYPGKGARSAAYNVWSRPQGKSAVEFHLASLRALGWETETTLPALHVTEAEVRAAQRQLGEFGVPATATLVGLHPGARWPTRRWAPEDFAALGRDLLARRPRSWLALFAGPGEEELARGIVAAIANPRAFAITNVALRRFVSLLKLCRAFVAGDSGPLHVAVAAGTPTIGIFGRNEPDRFFPYPESAGHRAVYAGVWCSPCHRDICGHLSCLRAISPERVGQELDQALAGAPDPAAA